MADDRKEQLHSMLRNFIQDNNEAAQLDFHSYVSTKMNEITGVKQEQKEVEEVEEEVE